MTKTVPGTVAAALMTAQERDKTIRLLRESQQAFLNAVESLDDVQWSYKPAAGLSGR